MGSFFMSGEGVDSLVELVFDVVVVGVSDLGGVVRLIADSFIPDCVSD